MKAKLKPFLLINDNGAAIMQALHRLREQLMPASAALELSAFAREAAEQCQSCLDARNAAIRNHGTPGAQGPVIEPGTEAMTKFLAELTALADREVELKLKAKIKLPARIEIKGSDWDLLEEFIELAG